MLDAHAVAFLNLLHQQARDTLDKAGKLAKDEDKNPKSKAENTASARKWMCEQFFDIRASAPNHSPRFYVDENCLKLGVKALSALALDWLAKA